MSHRLIVAIVLAALLSLVGVNAVLACDDYSPGYWKNHVEAWPAPYTPETDFDTAIGEALGIQGFDMFDPDISLMDALRQGGGGIKRDGRYMAADLLNGNL